MMQQFLSRLTANPALDAAMSRAGTPRPWGTAARWATLAKMPRLWAARRRERCALAELDNHLLRDIGVSRDEARRESRLPFWRP